MKGLIPPLCLFVLPMTSFASTVLLTHQGSTDPTTEGWGKTATTTVVGEAYNDDGREVWRVYDPGLSSGGTNLTYSTSLTVAEVASVMETGWELSATLSIPTTDPTEDVAWANGSNTWVGFIMNETASNRRLWALTFGRSASGDTLVSAYGVSGTLTLAPGYHDYSLVYDPITALVSISVDGELWKTYGGGSLSGNGTQLVYWGDNFGQSASQPERSAYYESVQFTSAPEPSRLLLLGLGMMALWGRRHKRSPVHAR